MDAMPLDKTDLDGNIRGVMSNLTSLVVNGKSLDIVCSNFGNRIFILVTDISKVGTLLLVTKECKGPDNPTTFSVKTLLGKSEPQVEVFGRAIGDHVLSSPTCSCSSLLLGLGIKNPDPLIIPKLLPVISKATAWS